MFEYLVILGVIFVVHFFIKTITTTKMFPGKVVVITGASSGIGEACALQFASIGAKLVFAARRIDRLDALVHKCKEMGASDAIAIQFDATKESDCKNLVDTTIQKFGQIDLLLLNAGMGSGLKFSQMEDMKLVRDLMDVNFYGYVYPTNYALPHLRKSKGTIVAISSLAALLPSPRRTTYGATKAAVNMFFRTLRLEEPDIRISIVNPGFVVTEIFEKSQTPRKLVGDTSKFMTAPECARIIVDAAITGTKEVVMTSQGKFGNFLRVFLPDITDAIAKKIADSSVDVDSKLQ